MKGKPSHRRLEYFNFDFLLYAGKQVFVVKLDFVFKKTIRASEQESEDVAQHVNSGANFNWFFG